MIKAIIFDFDGVIVDTERKKFKELQNLMNSTKFILTECDFKDMIGKKTSAFLSEKFPDMDKKEIKKTEEQRRKKLKNTEEKILPGLKKLILYLQSKKIKIAITTGTVKEIVEKTLRSNEISSFFDTIVTGEDFKESKPFPECYEKTLKKLQLNPSEIIVIEDSIAGIKAARAAKCKVFGIMTSLEKKDLLEADNIFTSHGEIENYFRENLKITTKTENKK